MENRVVAKENIPVQSNGIKIIEYKRDIERIKVSDAAQYAENCN